MSSRLPRLARVLPCLAIGSISILMACSDSADVDPNADTSVAALTDPGAEPELTDPVPDTPGCAAKIDRFRELEIVHPAVIQSARASNVSDGPWSFRFLVEQMAPAGTSVSDFVMKMLNSWKTDQTVNGVTVSARPNIQSDVIQPWLTASGSQTTLDMSKAPFVLQAIVYRPDLHATDCSTGGEGRFVFGLEEGGRMVSFTMIFEFHLPVTGTVTPHTWAARFHKLHNLDIVHADTPGDSGLSFNQELETITREFNTRGAMPSGPNGNAISQVRTNEIELAGPWQLREFHLVADKTGAGFLVPATTAQSPTQDINNTQILHDFISDNKDAINNGTIVIKNKYTDTLNGQKQTVSVLGPHSDSDGHPWMQQDPTTPRNPNPIDQTTLTNFNFLTCNGCHNLEGEQIDGFYHVSPLRAATGTDRTAGSNKLSTFLLGNQTVPSDLTRRAKVMSDLICKTECPAPLAGPEAARVE